MNRLEQYAAILHEVRKISCDIVHGKYNDIDLVYRTIMSHVKEAYLLGKAHGEAVTLCKTINSMVMHGCSLKEALKLAGITEDEYNAAVNVAYLPHTK